VRRRRIEQAGATMGEGHAGRVAGLLRREGIRWGCFLKPQDRCCK
jgi:hypothetical protein